jgi:hypothetical protein
MVKICQSCKRKLVANGGVRCEACAEAHRARRMYLYEQRRKGRLCTMCGVSVKGEPYQMCAACRARRSKLAAMRSAEREAAKKQTAKE